MDMLHGIVPVMMAGIIAKQGPHDKRHFCDAQA
jgi:hypothetical protein